MSPLPPSWGPDDGDRHLSINTNLSPQLSSSPSSSSSLTSFLSSFSRVTGRERMQSTSTLTSNPDDDTSNFGLDSTYLSPSDANTTQPKTTLGDDDSPMGYDTSPSVNSTSSPTTDIHTPAVLSPFSPQGDPATVYDPNTQVGEEHEEEEWSSPGSNSQDGATPRAEIPPPVWALSKISRQTLLPSSQLTLTQSLPNFGQDKTDQKGQLEDGISKMTISSEASRAQSHGSRPHSTGYEAIRKEASRLRKHSSLDDPPIPAKAVGSYFPTFASLESHPSSSSNSTPAPLSEQALQDASKRVSLPTHTEGVVTQTASPLSIRPSLTATSSSASVSSTGSLTRDFQTPITHSPELPISQELRRYSSSSTSSPKTILSRNSISGCSISSPKSPPAHYPYLPGKRSSSATRSQGSSAASLTSSSSSGSNRAINLRSKPVIPIPPTPKWATPPVLPSSASLSGTVTFDTEDIFSVEYEEELFKGHDGEWVETMKAEDGRISLLSFEKKYIVLIWLPGFSFENIVVSTRNKNTLHIVADQWDEEDHAQWDIKLGEDAVMTSIRAQFDKHQLRVTVNREALMPIPLYRANTSTSFSTFSSSASVHSASSTASDSMARIGSRINSSSRSLNMKEVRDDQ